MRQAELKGTQKFFICSDYLIVNTPHPIYEGIHYENTAVRGSTKKETRKPKLGTVEKTNS